MALFRNSNQARGAFVALAFLALFVVLARPVCDVSHAHGATWHDQTLGVLNYLGAEAPSHDDSDPCCSSVDEASLVGEVMAFAPDIKSPSVVPFAHYSSESHVSRTSLRTPVPPDRPPVTRPYYARSARILI